MDGTVASCAPSLFTRLRWALWSWPRAAKHALARALLGAVVRLASDGNLMAHARRELRCGLAAPKDGPDHWMANDLLQLVAVFSLHGHSGFSAPYCASAFADLARFQPLGPLTGDADEWIDHGNGVFQNNRCSHVFKQPDRFDGQAYDIEGRIFREPNGACFTNRDSLVPVTFPYTPKREYVDVPQQVYEAGI
jgi:hypothetical protein